MERPDVGTTSLVFFFFSNRMGCLPSLLLSVVVTVLLLYATGAIR